jgi:hypothetical protein
MEVVFHLNDFSHSTDSVYLLRQDRRKGGGRRKWSAGSQGKRDEGVTIGFVGFVVATSVIGYANGCVTRLNSRKKILTV